jgi:hypothetical protein
MDELDLGSTIRGFSPGQKVFARYTLRKILGRGGMGVVWLARDEELERDVALKFLPEVVAMDKQAILELKRETRRSLELTHSHIIRIYDFVQDGRTAAISMEYVAGDTLAALKLDQPHQCYAAVDLAKWVRQLCEALDYAHGKAQVVHRDLKPANLMIDARGDLKVADFGIAASVSDSVSRVSNQAGSSGTPVYMSPQQMMGEKPAVSDDIYSLGATLYDLLTGRPPFHSGNIIAQVQAKVPPPVSERLRDAGIDRPVPPEWDQAIAACLAKDAEARPKSAREMAQLLGVMGAATSAPFMAAPAKTSAPPPAVAQAPAKPAAKPEAKTEPTKPGGNKGLLVGALAGLLLLGGGLGWYFGLHVPEQKRLAEIARLEAEGRAAEAERLRNEKEKADAAAREKAEQEQQAFALVVARIEALLDGAPEVQKVATDKAVKEYLVSAPARYRADVEGRWAKRLNGWETHRLNTARGGFRIRTKPEGAEVQVGSLALEKSPLTRNEVRLGAYPVIIRAEGYEEWRGEIVVKENDFTDPGVIALVRSTGTLDLRSDPAGAEFTLQQQGRENTQRTGRLPAVLEGLPTGSYTVTARFPGLAEVSRQVEISRAARTPVELPFAYGALVVSSVPAGAEVWRDGRVLGRTPFNIETVAVGDVVLEFRSKGHARQRLTGRVENRRELRLAATLKKGGLDEPEAVVQSILEELEKETNPEIRAGILTTTAYALQRLGQIPPDLIRNVLDRQLEAARQIQNPKARLAALGNSAVSAAEYDLAYSRAWAEAAVAAIARITDKDERTGVFYTASLFWMHPDLADRMATVMDDWFSGNDSEWAYASMVAGLHKRFGNERGAQLMAGRAKGPYRDDAINNNVKDGASYRLTDPIQLRLLRGDLDGARQMLRAINGQLSFSAASLLAYQFMLRGDFDTARQLGGRVEPNMAPYYPSTLVAYALSANNPAFAESLAAGLADEGDTTRRSDAYRDIAAYYARIGMKDKARAAAAQIRSFGNPEYGLGRQQAVPVLAMVGDLNRARQIAQSVPVSYAADKAYLGAWNAQMFLSIGDTASFERCMQLYAQSAGATTDWIYGYQIPQLLATLGRHDEAASYLERARDSNMRYSGLNIVNLARLRAAKPEDQEALVDSASAGAARASLLGAVLQLRLEKQQLARSGL